MIKTSLFARLAAFGAAAAVTFSVVAVIADYGLPADGQQLLVQATTAAIR